MAETTISDATGQTSINDLGGSVAPRLKIIGLEEHYITPAIAEANAALPPELRDPSVALQGDKEIANRLLDLGDERIRQMDDMGMDVAVLSVTTPSTQSLAPSEAVPLARAANDVLAGAVSRYPNRLLGFATLPTPDPQASVAELTRCVQELGFKGAMLNGRTRDKYLDHEDFFPIFEAAARLGVPVYIHPQGPPIAVQQAHFSGFDDKLNAALATGGYGWHVETGINALRLIVSGVFDKLPDLQIILGHWGETIAFYLERVDGMSKAAGLDRPVAQTFRENFYITPAGIYSVPMLLHAMQTLGADRILYSADYPFRPAGGGKARAFLENAPISPADKEKMAWGNAARLLRLPPA